MKDKIVVAYATNRSISFQETFCQHLFDSSGLSENEISILSYPNDGKLSLTASYNILWKSASVVENAVFVFIHHDIHFKSQNWGRELLHLFNTNAIDIIGIAGTEVLYPHCVWTRDQNFEVTVDNLWGKVWHSIENQEVLIDFSGNNKPASVKYNDLHPVVVIDGVFMAFNPETCSQFDEDFDNFHFYDISFCVKNFLQGKKIAVTENIQIFHESVGETNETWEKNRAKLYNKYIEYLPLSI